MHNPGGLSMLKLFRIIKNTWFYSFEYAIVREKIDMQINKIQKDMSKKLDPD